MTHLTDSATTLAALAAGVAGIGYLIRVARRWARILERLYALADHELRHNHGGSMKDDLHGLAVASRQISEEVGALRDDLSDLRTQFENHTHP